MGTFRWRHASFRSCVIRAMLSDSTVTCVYALLPGISQAVYKAMLHVHEKADVTRRQSCLSNDVVGQRKRSSRNLVCLVVLPVCDNCCHSLLQLKCSLVKGQHLTLRLLKMLLLKMHWQHCYLIAVIDVTL